MCIEFEQKMKNQFDKLDTPCFIVRTKKLDCLIDEMRQSVNKYFPRALIGYSFKTNNLPWAILHAKQKGLIAEVVSSDEYSLAKALGFSISDIIFNGPVKRKKEFIEAVESGAIVNIDSHRELDWLLEVDRHALMKSRLGLRINFCIEENCPGESQCGKEDGRFGFSVETGELGKVIKIFQDNDIPLSGLHLHVSSRTRSLNIYRAIAEVAVEVVHTHHLSLRYIDVGGGFFGGVPGKPSFDDYFSVIKDVFDRSVLLKDILLIIEPGMSLIGASVDYLSKVVDVKQTKNNTFALLDGSRVHIDPLMRKSNYTYRVLSSRNYPKMSEVILCGFTCMEADRFFKYSGEQICTNDYVLFEKVGAYTMGLSPQFIEAYPAVYKEDGGFYSLVREKQALPIK